MQRRSYLLIGVTLALILGGVAPMRASQMVWSGLVMANNVAQPDEIPPELNRIEGTLKALFGYNQFKVIGQSRKTLVTGSEDWLASSKYFSLASLKEFMESGLKTEARIPPSPPPDCNRSSAARFRSKLSGRGNTSNRCSLVRSPAP